MREEDLSGHDYRRALMIIALASPRIASAFDGLEKIRQALPDASAQGAQIVCFPGIKMSVWSD